MLNTVTVYQLLATQWDNNQQNRHDNGYHIGTRHIRPGQSTIKPFNPVWTAPDQSIVVTGQSDRVTPEGHVVRWIRSYFVLNQSVTPAELVKFACRNLIPERGWEVHRETIIDGHTVHVYEPCSPEFHLGLTAHTLTPWDTSVWPYKRRTPRQVWG